MDPMNRWIDAATIAKLRGGARPEAPALKLFKVEDGATHWVIAKHPGHCVRLMAESVGETRESYLNDYEVEVTEVGNHEQLSIRMDGAVVEPSSLDGPIPSKHHTDVQVRADVRAWIKAYGKPGIIASTEV